MPINRPKPQALLLYYYYTYQRKIPIFEIPFNMRHDMKKGER